jgi:hypothetical protein
VYQSCVESREVESSTNLAADEPLSSHRSFGSFRRPPWAQPQNQWGLTPRACLHAVPPVGDPVGSRALSQPHLSHTFTHTSSSRGRSFGSCVDVQLVGINSTRLPTRRPTCSGSRGILCTEPTTPQPHVYPHLIEPRQILWILCGCPTTRKTRICLHLAGPLQIRPGSFVAATQSAMWAATCAWVSL